MTIAEKIIKPKLGLLELAKPLGMNEASATIVDHLGVHHKPDEIDALFKH